MNNSAGRLKHVHAALTIVWFLMVPIAITTGWISSVVFIAACSIYANAVGHFAAWQASRSEQASEDES